MDEADKPSAQAPVQFPGDRRDVLGQVPPYSSWAARLAVSDTWRPTNCGERGNFKRRRPDSNRGSRICSPLPYHLATAPTKKGASPLDAAPPRVAQSGKPDSNRRPQPWQGCALPTELFPRNCTGQNWKPVSNCQGSRARFLLSCIVFRDLCACQEFGIFRDPTGARSTPDGSTSHRRPSRRVRGRCFPSADPRADY